ncbi:MAG: 4Fe-4S dicluster domain-containing protein, partial [Clostridia bacterium]|nr:4Fe-4S dicluster domain-containing protein [Clostridia bacterium]
MGNKNFFDTYDKSACCGCRACEQICKKQAITMVSDDEGFIYPQINRALCVECNVCKNICPVSKGRAENTIIKVYEAQNKDEELLKKSSSGGVFINIAKYVLDNNGIVFGAVLN